MRHAPNFASILGESCRHLEKYRNNVTVCCQVGLISYEGDSVNRFKSVGIGVLAAVVVLGGLQVASANTPSSKTAASTKAPTAVAPPTATTNEQCRANNKDGNKSKDNNKDGQKNCGSAIVPGAPTSLVTTAGNTQLSIAFTAGSDGGSTITDYQYTINAGSTWTTAATVVSPVVITGLTNGTTYTVSIRAINLVGSGTASTATTGTPVTVSGAPIDETCNTSFVAGNFVFGGDPTATVSGATVTLTQASGGQLGTIWSPTRINLANNFCISAEVYLGSADGGADGLAFVLQTEGTGAGSSGGGLGYAGITPSFAVEYDTYQNGEIYDPAADHLGLMKNGSTTHSTTAGSNGWGVLPVSVVNLEDNQWRKTKIYWNAATGQISVFLDLNSDGDITDAGETIFNAVSVDLLSYFNASSGLVYWGFTAATGGAYNLHQVRNIAYTVAPDAPTIGIATSTGATTATVAFTAPASNGGATITTYTATSSPGGITATLSQAGSGTITVTGLTESTLYTFTVTATNSAGTSSASDASGSITTGAYAIGDTGPAGGKIFILPFSQGGLGGAYYYEAALNTWSGGGSDPIRVWATTYAGCGDSSNADCQTYSIYTDAAASDSRTASTAIGMGQTNTTTIVAKHAGVTFSTYAAGLADSYTVTTSGVAYSDWFLPSKEELNQLCWYANGQTQSTEVCNSSSSFDYSFAAGSGYWSSSESSAGSASIQYFFYLFQSTFVKNEANLFVRPVRRF